jgi:dihydrofolate synthase/folylpolyglutamate synthase
MMASALREGGYRTGLYTSPHLHRMTERIVADGEPIPPEEFGRLVETLRPHVEAEDAARPPHSRLSTFELLTALAFLHFRDRGVAWQVLETGLGGRLDATNVFERKDLCVITPISLEHTAILGNTVAQIATEKAAIITPETPVVMGLQRESAAEVVRAACAERWAPLWEVAGKCALTKTGHTSDEQDFRLRTPGGTFSLRLPLLGQHQLENAATAVLGLEVLREHGLELSEAAIRDGLAKVRWPGRLEIIKRRPLVVLDGAHDAESARRIRSALTECLPYARAILVVGTSGDKDVSAIAAELESVPRLERVIATRSRHPRAAPAQAVAAAFGERHVPTVSEEEVSLAVESALALAEPGDMICVLGSLFVAAEAREHVLGIEADWAVTAAGTPSDGEK